MDSNSEIQGYYVYPMLHFHRKFSSGITAVLLYKIVKKDVLFEWGPTQQKVQQDLKILIEDCFHMRNPKFLSE